MLRALANSLGIKSSKLEREQARSREIGVLAEGLFSLAKAGLASEFIADLEEALSQGVTMEELHRSAGSPMEAACSTAKHGPEMIAGLLKRMSDPRSVLVVSHEGCIEPLEICFRRQRWGSARFLLVELKSRGLAPGGEALRWAMDALAGMARKGTVPEKKEIRRMLAHFPDLSAEDKKPGLTGLTIKPEQPRLLWRAVPCLAAVEVLLNRGASLDEIAWSDPRDPSVEGSTALHKAAGELSEGCVEALLKAGASALIKNAMGRTPAEEARAGALRLSGGRARESTAILAAGERIAGRLEAAEAAQERALRGPRRILMGAGKR